MLLVPIMERFGQLLVLNYPKIATNKYFITVEQKVAGG